MCIRDRRKGVDSLESLRSQALAQGVEFIACQMSMDMMGIQDVYKRQLLKRKWSSLSASARVTVLHWRN